MDTKYIVDALKAAIDATIEFQNSPATYQKTRNGWAGYKRNIRITLFCFTEEQAREAVIAWEASDVKVTW